MSTKTGQEGIKVKKVRTIRKAAKAALGGASVGTMLGAAFFVSPFAVIMGALVGALVSTKLDAVLDGDEEEDDDSINYHKEDFLNISNSKENRETKEYINLSKHDKK